jgi:hypothetical protein
VWSAAVSSEGLERLRRAAEADGLIPRTGKVFHERTLQLACDERLLSHRCGVCLRSIDPRNNRPIWPGEFACGACWLLRGEQAGEWVYRHWFALPAEVRRRRLAQHFGIDPATWSYAVAEVEFQRFINDVDGAPAFLEVAHQWCSLSAVLADGSRTA